MKILKKYYLLMILIIIIAPMFVHIINQNAVRANQEQVKTIEYRIEKTDKSDFGYDPNTKKYQATSVEAINNFFTSDRPEINDEKFYSMGFEQIIPSDVKECPTLYNRYSTLVYAENFNDYDWETCIIDVPIGVSEIDIVDQVSVPLKFSETQIDTPKYKYLINGDGTLSYDINIINNGYYSNTSYYEYINYYYYYGEYQVQAQEIDMSDNLVLKLEYYFAKNNIQAYIIYAIVMLIAFWSAKQNGVRVNAFITIFILFILINLMFLFTTTYLPLSEQIKDIQSVILMYNFLYIPMYLRIIIKNRK